MLGIHKYGMTDCKNHTFIVMKSGVPGFDEGKVCLDCGLVRFEGYVTPETLDKLRKKREMQLREKRGIQKRSN